MHQLSRRRQFAKRPDDSGVVGALVIFANNRLDSQIHSVVKAAFLATWRRKKTAGENSQPFHEDCCKSSEVLQQFPNEAISALP